MNATLRDLYRDGADFADYVYTGTPGRWVYRPLPPRPDEIDRELAREEARDEARAERADDYDNEDSDDE